MEKEKKIMETIARAVKGASEQTKDYLMDWAEGAAYTVCRPSAEVPAAWSRGWQSRPGGRLVREG